jgi:hypothetical protein
MPRIKQEKEQTMEAASAPETNQSRLYRPPVIPVERLNGGGDTHILAARVKKEALLTALSRSDRSNPYL